MHKTYGRHEIGWVTSSTDDKDLMAQIGEGKRDDVKVMDFEELAQELGI